MIIICREDLKIYCHVVFSYSSGLVPFRSFSEKDNSRSRPISNKWVQADDELLARAVEFAEAANRRQAAFYVVPGTVMKENQASSHDIMEMQTLLIDIDEGDTEAKLSALAAAIGEPTMIIESGGVTKEGYAKLHVYWQLERAARGEDLRLLLDLRYRIALAFGGDTHFKSAHQPIRVAGSVYHKGGKVKVVKIRCYNPVEYTLGELAERLSDRLSLDKTKPLNSNSLPIDDILITKVHEGASGEQTRFNHLQRIIGYWLRRYHDDLISEAEAMEEIIAYNEANVIPPWPVERLKPMVKGIWAKHMKENGHINNSADLSPQSTYIELYNWTAKRYSHKAPKQDYLVESIIPMRVATILAATGDAGKSMLLLNLALQVASGSPMSEILGHNVTQRGTAIVFTAEDDIDEVHRRLEYLDPNGLRNKQPNKLIIVPLASIGDPLLCVTKTREGIKISKEFMELKKQITSIVDLKLIIFDPLSSFVQADISKDPSDGSFVTGLFASLATETGAAVILAHHMRKPQGNYQINSPEEAREAVRGSGALVDGVRNVYSLWQSPHEEQKMVFSMLARKYERNRVYRGAVVKCNSAADREVRIFFRSDKGLLEDITTLTQKQDLPKDQMLMILRNSIAHSAAEGFPYTHTGQNGIYKQRHKLPKIFHHLSRQKIEDMVQQMLNSRPALIVKGRAQGSKEEKWLDVPSGKFAIGEGEFTEGAEVEFLC